MRIQTLYEQVQEFGKQLPSYSEDLERYNMGDNVIAIVELSRTRIKDKRKNRLVSCIKFSTQ